MKKFITILSLALTTLGMTFGQNVLFVEFSNSYDQVVSSMQAREYVQIEATEPGRRLVVSSQGATYTYLFHEGWLYEVKMNRKFDKKNIAKQAYKSCREYFDWLKADQVAVLKNERQEKEQVFVRTGRVYRIKYRTEVNGQVEITLRSRYTANTPLSQWERYDYKAGYDITQTMNQ